MIEGKNFLDQLVKSEMRKFDNSQKIGTGQGDDSVTGSSLDYPYFKEHYNVIVMDLST